MAIYTEIMRSLVLPLTEKAAVVPNAAVAEIVAYQDPEMQQDKPEWYLGNIEWRGLSVPVILYEAFAPETRVSVDYGVRIAIMNSISGDSALPFYGLVTQGIPHLTTLREGDIVGAGASDDDGLPILQNVIVHGQDALIPDLQALEEKVKAA